MGVAHAPAKTKAQALRSYDVADFPALTGREEEWRFTPLKRLRGLHDGTAVADGGLHHSRGELPAGVTVGDMPLTDPRRGSVLVPFDRVSADAYGQADRVLAVTVADGATVTEPAWLRVDGDRSGTVAFGHTIMEVGKLASATIVLDQVGSLVLADNLEVVVGDGAQLTLVTVADWAPDAVQAQHVRFRVGRDAKVTHYQITLGGDLVRQYTSVEFAGRGGDIDAYGLYFADAGQHHEHRLLIDHGVPDCRSYVNYRGGLQGESTRTVWVGDVLIQTEATGTDTYEINRNLVLSDGARAVSVPNLEIETGEVVGAGHASATARFDDEQLFYLMSRGIEAEEARRLVVRGFFAELVGRVPVPELRDRLEATIEDRLAKAFQSPPTTPAGGLG